MKKTLLTALAVVCALSVAAPAMDWTGMTGVGGYVSWDDFGSDTALPLSVQYQGASALYGVSKRLRVGGDLGFTVANHGSPSETNAGFNIVPTADYDLISKNSGVVYLAGHLLDYAYSNGSVTRGSADAWSLGFATVGLGIEAVVDRSFGVSLEGDFFRVGISGGTGSPTSADVSAMLFPSTRLAVRYYFGGKRRPAAPQGE